jgi:hypothetical protein
MHGSVVVSWILTAVFIALTWPCMVRLVRLDYVRLGQTTRNGDVAELLLVLAMVAMLSPIGGPIPAAGWEAVFLLASAWFLLAWWRGRRTPGHSSPHGQCAHHALSAVAMLYMVAAMPHDGAVRGPWLTMSTMETQGGLAWPAVAVLAAAFFAVDAIRSGVVAVRASPGAAASSGFISRAACRSVMGIGMGYLLVAAAL